METSVDSCDAAGQERFNHWRELIRQGFAPMNITTDRPDRFHAGQRIVPLGRLQVWEAVCSRSESSRNTTLIRQSDPETLCMHITLNGTLFAETAGRNVACTAGDLLIHDTSHPMRTAFREPRSGLSYRGVAVMIPRAELPLTGRIDRVVGLRVPQDDGVGALMSKFVTDLIHRADDLRPTDTSGLGAVVRELASTLVVRTADAEGLKAKLPSRSILELRVKEFIIRHLGDQDLSPATIAAAHHISLSYLHEIFQKQDKTVTRWIRHQRLENAYRDLVDPSRAALTIGEIAARWGFRYQADFARAFRATYGLAPRDHRQGALPRTGQGATSDSAAGHTEQS